MNRNNKFSDISNKNINANKIYHDYVAEKYESDPRVRLGVMHKNCGKRLEWLKDKYFVNGRNFVVLNIGVGTGNLMKESNKIFGFSIGMDISKNMLIQAKRYSNRLVQGNALEIPLKSQALDLVFSVALLHHIYDLESFFKSVYYVLKKGGIFYSDYDPNQRFHRTIKRLKLLNFLLSLYKRFSDLFINIKKDSLREIHDIAEFHEEFNKGLNPDYIVEIMKKVGFSNVYAIYHSDSPNLDYPRKGRLIHKISEMFLIPFSKNYSERAKIFAIIGVR